MSLTDKFYKSKLGKALKKGSDKAGKFANDATGGSTEKKLKKEGYSTTSHNVNTGEATGFKKSSPTSQSKPKPKPKAKVAPKKKYDGNANTPGYMQSKPKEESAWRKQMKKPTR